MLSEQEILQKLKPVLEQHPYVSVEFGKEGLRTLIQNFRPNLLGNFAGGDMAYIANAAAGLECVARDLISETASISIECINRGDGECLVGDATVIKAGPKLIRLRVDVYVRKEKIETLVAIAQINMSVISNRRIKQLITG